MSALDRARQAADVAATKMRQAAEVASAKAQEVAAAAKDGVASNTATSGPSDAPPAPQARFVVTETPSNTFRFTLYAETGERLMNSAEYASHADVLIVIDAVRRAAKSAEVLDEAAT